MNYYTLISIIIDTCVLLNAGLILTEYFYTVVLLLLLK